MPYPDPPKLVGAVLAVAALILASCSASSSPPATAPKTATTVPVSTLNKGICSQVPPSVVATQLQINMNYPKAISSGSTTQCLFRGKKSSSTELLIRYDTDSSAAKFAADEGIFKAHGQKVGAVTGFGDEAYYFSTTVGAATLTTVAARQGALQVLVTGTATLPDVAALAHYAVTRFFSFHPTVTSTTG